MSSKNPQLYVGSVSRDVRTEEIERVFSEFGKVREISHKNRYAFVVSF
jgi:RNA recognition motif-containing protein